MSLPFSFSALPLMDWLAPVIVVGGLIFGAPLLLRLSPTFNYNNVKKKINKLEKRVSEANKDSIFPADKELMDKIAKQVTEMRATIENGEKPKNKRRRPQAQEPEENEQPEKPEEKQPENPPNVPNNNLPVNPNLEENKEKPQSEEIKPKGKNYLKIKHKNNRRKNLRKAIGIADNLKELIKEKKNDPNVTSDAKKDSDKIDKSLEGVKKEAGKALDALKLKPLNFKLIIQGYDKDSEVYKQAQEGVNYAYNKLGVEVSFVEEIKNDNVTNRTINFLLGKSKVDQGTINFTFRSNNAGTISQNINYNELVTQEKIKNVVIESIFKFEKEFFSKPPKPAKIQQFNLKFKLDITEKDINDAENDYKNNLSKPLAPVPNPAPLIPKELSKPIEVINEQKIDLSKLDWLNTNVNTNNKIVNFYDDSKNVDNSLKALRYQIKKFFSDHNEIKQFFNFNELLTKSIECFKNDNAYLNLPKGNFIIVGDTHGEPDKTLGVFQTYITHLLLQNNNSSILFLGDYVDRGYSSIINLALLLTMKINFPDRVFLLRGNHEDREVYSRFGFSQELYEFKGNNKAELEKLMKLVDDVFEQMPFFAVLFRKYFVVHGGISLTDDNAFDIQKIRNIADDQFDPVVPLNHHLTWNDPGNNTMEMKGRGWKFDLESLNKAFNKLNTDSKNKFGFQRLIRAHQYEAVVEHLNNFNGKVISLFSASYGSGYDAFIALVNFNIDEDKSSISFEVFTKPRVTDTGNLVSSLLKKAMVKLKTKGILDKNEQVDLNEIAKPFSTSKTVMGNPNP